MFSQKNEFLIHYLHVIMERYFKIEIFATYEHKMFPGMVCNKESRSRLSQSRPRALLTMNNPTSGAQSG
jgi:hypothetical protein